MFSSKYPVNNNLSWSWQHFAGWEELHGSYQDSAVFTPTMLVI
jgi:hypothetical protein